MAKSKVKRIVDNKMRAFGDFDPDTNIIRVNKKKNKKAGLLQF